MLGPHFAHQLHLAYHGENWTHAALLPWVKKLRYDQACQQHPPFELTPLQLIVHITYYTRKLKEVLEGKPLTGTDEDSFLLPEINNESQWDQFLHQITNEAQQACKLLENLSDNRFYEVFGEVKYGTLLRNVTGTIEHLYYHLGQLVNQIKAIDTRQVKD